MVKMTVPVTSGGKSLRTFLKKTPKRMATTPPTSSAPSSVPKPNSKPMAWKAGRKANETPVRMGRLEPMRPKSGNCWRSVSRAVRMRATWMMAVSWASVKLQVLAIIIAGAMAPAKQARTCCREHGRRFFRDGTPSRWNSSGDSACSFSTVVWADSLMQILLSPHSASQTQGPSVPGAPLAASSNVGHILPDTRAKRNPQTVSETWV